jgi:hypothetical protein
MPVLAITGQQARMAIGGHYQQEVDLPAMFKELPAPSCVSAPRRGPTHKLPQDIERSRGEGSRSAPIGPLPLRQITPTKSDPGGVPLVADLHSDFGSHDIVHCQPV